jgi:hypothetical protein
MARTIGVDPSTLLKWERGEHRPTGRAATRWVEELTRLAERGKPTRRRSTSSKVTTVAASDNSIEEVDSAQRGA